MKLGGSKHFKKEANNLKLEKLEFWMLEYFKFNKD